MSANGKHTRRHFVAGTLAVGGGLVLLAGQQRAMAVAKPFVDLQPIGAVGDAPTMASTPPQLLLFDADRAEACRSLAEGLGISGAAFASGSAHSDGCTVRPIVGDRVRFAREVFAAADAPAVVAGLTSHSDFILLSGCAAEHGYRVLSERVLSVADAAAGRLRALDARAHASQGALVEWKVARLRRVTCRG